MNTKGFFIVLISFTIISCGTSKKIIMSDNIFDPKFTKLWEKIDSLEQQGLTRSAFETTDSIFKSAKENKITDQIIKALLYKSKYANTLEENSIDKFEKNILNEIAIAEQPEKSLLQSILAEFYDNYLANNFYKISQMTDSDDDNSDIKTWPASRFILESNKLYDESISIESLKNISYTSISEIFTKPENNKDLRETIYEILAYRALEHYKNDRYYLPKSSDKFLVNSSTYFSLPDQFINLNIISIVPDDTKFKTLKLFQEIEKNSFDKQDFPELIDIYLNRLEFVHNQYSLQDSDDLYIKSLNNLIEKYPAITEIAEAFYLLAVKYKMQGEEDSGQYKWKNKESLELCNIAIQKYPESLGAQKCKALKNEILENNLNCSIESVNLPGEKLLTEIRYKNLKNVFQKLINVDGNILDVLNSMPKDQDIYINSLPTEKNWQVIVPDDGDLRNHSTESGIEPLTLGSYLLVSSDNKEFNRSNGLFTYQIFHVSNLAYWVKTDKNGNHLFVVDRKSGDPIENAKVSFFEYSWNNAKRINEKVLVSELLTNKNGIVNVPENNDYRSYEIVISKDADILKLNENVYTGKIGENSPYTNVIFFTDRSIYRPGQTLFYKGLMLNYDNAGIPSIVKNKTNIKVELLDANHQKIQEISTKTNDFGSFNGSFNLPQSGLTGNMYIRELSTNTYYSFTVEEYKRPKFEVFFEDYKENYKLGDTILVKGTALSFSGFPLQNANIKYKVKRKVYFPYFYGYRIPPFRNDDLEISHGTLTTDDNGNFLVPVQLFASDIQAKKEVFNFLFEINADVTDISGETHSAQKSISAGSIPVNIQMTVDEKVKSGKELNISVTATNNSGQKTSAKGKVTIYKLIEPDKIFRDRYWGKPDTFIYSRDEFYRMFPYYAYQNDDDKKFWNVETKTYEFEFNTEKNEKYSKILKEGEYRIVLDYLGENDKKIEIVEYATVYSDSKLPSGELLLVETDKSKYEIPNISNIKWQSSVSNLRVFTSIWKRNNELIEEKWNNFNKTDSKKIELKEDHRGGLVVANTYIYNNIFYEKTTNIDIPWSNKDLSFEFIYFRSKLYPGQDEEWRIKVKGEKAESFVTEILASMYDASLDKIFQSDWTKSINYPSVWYRPVYAYGFSQVNSILLYPDNYFDRYYPDTYKSYRNINWFGFNVYDQYEYSGVAMRSDGIQYKRSLVAGAENPEAMPGQAEHMPSPPQMKNGAGNDIILSENIAMPKKEKNADEPDKTRIQLRSNLNETVFFYPDIKTDEKGNFILSFKMNEALTKWKLRLFAYTKDLKFAYDEKEIITQKDLMITPNNPRFVRKGDNLKFNLKIENLTEKTLSGSSWVELFDAATMQSVDKIILNDESTKKFSLNGKNSTTLQWDMKFKNDVPDLLIYRFYAKSSEFSDAEEGFLPVLTNQKLVTESLPLWVGANNTRSFTLQSLKNSTSNELKNISYTIEATSNPLWICIQSLPYVKDIKYENTICLSNALFTNILASKIADENPQIKRVFEKWQKSNSGINRQALLSSLNKNKELKNIVLEETPWVLDAIDEEEQKKNIALLFDLNLAKNDMKNLFTKLASFQNPDGGFPWFAGGRSSRYISQYILEVFGKLKKMNALSENSEIENLLNRTLVFVNEDVVKDYKKLFELAAEKKIDLDKNNLCTLDIHYLYTIQFYPESERSKDLSKAIDYYTTQASKYWIEQPIYLKAMIALILNRGENQKISVNIMKALEEQSIYNEELGRYWKALNGYNWWQLPIETQALVIEAFDEITKNQTIVDELKIWLIKNKQTNTWKTGKATVSAIYSLLQGNGVSLKETKPVTVFVANKNLSSPILKDEIQSGTGYFKKRIEGNAVKPEMADVRIDNPNDNIAWGAVYWQYLKDLDKIQSFEETPLKINRELFLVKDTDSGEKMTLINIGQKLEKGDKIRVKIRLEVDRPMEFVHLSDQRAATFEPIEQLSRYVWQGGLGYYQNPRDTKMNFFIDYLPKGVFVLEYSLRATQSGSFSNGIAELQSFYAPEFNSHSGGMSIEVK